ncbi:MAG: cyclic nucleotide-binding domain-containing protein, partial [Bacteroidota bacterium]
MNTASKDEDIELLQSNLSKYMNVSGADLQAMCSFYQPRKIEKREYVLRQGEICRFEAFVVKGCFKVSTTDDRGKEKILYFAEEGWWLMEIDSFMNATASVLNIQALEN